jgi:hypothetical protein
MNKHHLPKVLVLRFKLKKIKEENLYKLLRDRAT